MIRRRRLESGPGHKEDVTVHKEERLEKPFHKYSKTTGKDREDSQHCSNHHPSSCTNNLIVKAIHDLCYNHSIIYDLVQPSLSFLALDTLYTPLYTALTLPMLRRQIGYQRITLSIRLAPAHMFTSRHLSLPLQLTPQFRSQTRYRFPLDTSTPSYLLDPCPSSSHLGATFPTTYRTRSGMNSGRFI